MIVINRIDAENADLEAMLARIQQAAGSNACRSTSREKAALTSWDCFFNPDGEADFSSVKEAHSALRRPGRPRSTRR